MVVFVWNRAGRGGVRCINWPAPDFLVPSDRAITAHRGWRRRGMISRDAFRTRALVSACVERTALRNWLLHSRSMDSLRRRAAGLISQWHMNSGVTHRVTGVDRYRTDLPCRK
jgi:hypothetical protein